MEGLEFLDKLKEFSLNEDVIGVVREVNELNAHFQDYVLERERLLQIAQMDAQENEQDVPEDPELEQLKGDFREVLSLFREKRKRAIDERNAVEFQNLTKKKELIEKLRDIIQNEENIRHAFNALNDIQTAWKEIGDIPREQRDAIQSEYSRLIEDFFYNINIYKQLKEHDLKRNTQMKQEIVEKLQQLNEVNSIKEVEQQLKQLQNNWEDIGPVNNDQWELIKDNYWKAVHACYSRINAHYEEQRSVLLGNLQQKNKIVQEIVAFIDQIPPQTTVKFWEEATEEILSYQQKWRTIGFGPKKENEEVWQAFRVQCNRFFDAKKDFFQGIRQEQNKCAKDKQTLIEQLEQLKDNTNWKDTAQQIIKLQQQWKTIGNAGHRNEARLWKQFRSACDTFFNNRDKHFESIDAEFEKNLAMKEEIIAQIKAYQIPGDRKTAITDLKNFTMQFNELGKVPLKAKESIYKEFKTAIDQHYASLKLDGEEKSRVLFQAHIDTVASSPEATKLFAKEKADIRRKIEHLKHDVLLLENNLGFFGRSQRAEHLKRDVEKKIERIKQEISELQQRIKMIPT